MLHRHVGNKAQDETSFIYMKSIKISSLNLGVDVECQLPITTSSTTLS